MWASPADRDRSIEVIKASFAEGRLTGEELDQRLGQALVSRYFEELMALTADLPAGPFGRLPAHRMTPPVPRKNRLAVVALAVGWLLVLIGVGVALLVRLFLVRLFGPEEAGMAGPRTVSPCWWPTVEAGRGPAAGGRR